MTAERGLDRLFPALRKPPIGNVTNGAGSRGVVNRLDRPVSGVNHRSGRAKNKNGSARTTVMMYLSGMARR